MATTNSSTSGANLLSFFLYILLVALVGLMSFLVYNSFDYKKSTSADSSAVYVAPDSNFTHLWTAPSDWRMMYLAPEEKDLVQYGKELIAHTSDYLGPKGSVKSISNGMNCPEAQFKLNE
jgi:thiosulfate dehydrogenase